MRWGQSLYFLVLFLIPLGMVFFIFTEKKRVRDLLRLADSVLLSRLLPNFNSTRHKIRKLAFLISLFFLSLALAEPQWGYHWEDVVRKGVDLMLVVDLSNSMNAEDLKPSRLMRVRRKIQDLLKKVEGDRVGMVVFAGRAIQLCPLTLDYQAITQFIDSLSPDLIPIQGTDLSGALDLAMKNFKDPKSSKAILVMSDGEDFSEELKEIEGRLKKEAISVYVLGFGSIEGAPIPLEKGEGGFKRDSAGNVVLSKLEETTLGQLAASTGGIYVRSVTGDEDLDELYVKGLKGVLTDHEIKESKKRVYESRFQWPLAFGLLILVAEFLWREKNLHRKKD